MKKLAVFFMLNFLLTGCGHMGQLCIQKNKLTKAQLIELSQQSQNQNGVQNQNAQVKTLPICMGKYWRPEKQK